MGLLASFLREALHVRVEHWRQCEACRGTGEHHEKLRAPDGSVPVRAVVARIQCDVCKGKGKRLIAEQVTEKGLTRAWEEGRLVGARRR